VKKPPLCGFFLAVSENNVASFAGFLRGDLRVASIMRAGAGWRAQICVAGRREERSFRTRAEATTWATRREVELRAVRGGTAGQHKTVADGLRRYADEVATTHKGERWERVRITAMLSHRALPCTLPLDKLTGAHLAAWKEARLAEVSAASVLREMGLLGSVLSYCRRDWGWMSHNPMADVRRPKQPQHRERVISLSETRRMLRALAYHPQRRAATLKALVGAALLMSLRTGMRAGEVLGMQWAHMHTTWVTLPDTKNGAARDVPLSATARRLVERMRGLDDERVIPVSGPTLDALFRKARQAAGLDGFTFHDARHTAATRIGRTVGQPGRLSFPEFCKVFGWRDPKNALIYVNPSAADLAQRMA